MKIRTDFVTNSSSSSFILSKIEDNSIEKTYQLIRLLYLDMYHRRDSFLKYIEDHHLTEIVYKESEYNPDLKYFSLKKDEINGSVYWYEDNEYSEIMEKQFCLYKYDYFFDKPPEWTKCNTYAEYEQFALDRIKNHKKFCPFTIIDLSENTCKKIHNPYLIEDIQNDLLNWYFPYFDYAIDHLDNCKGCEVNQKNWHKSPADRKSCKLSKKILKKVIEDYQIDVTDKENLNQNIILHQMGRIAILSECGNLPQTVVNELEKFCDYSCNHMG